VALLVLARLTVQAMPTVLVVVRRRTA